MPGGFRPVDFLLAAPNPEIDSYTIWIMGIQKAPKFINQLFYGMRPCGIYLLDNEFFGRN